tara:strand:+ start:111 stop:299 length:189 start_codon:yes stop_codon:yes gene_type:complete
LRDLETLIKRAKNMMAYGLTQKEIKSDLERNGWHEELIHWAVRAAKFELDYQEELENAKLRG